MSDVLQRAKELQRRTATETWLWIELELLQALIAEIERLELVIAANGHRPRLVKEERQHD
jgi:hypothetical protein